jgi:hypothetical protein
MSLHETWTYEGEDTAIMLFTAALKAWQMPILPGQSVLELGCNESDFLPRLHRADPSLKLFGLDWRASDKEPDGWTFTQGTAWDGSLFPEQSFDWVVSLGALEHFGLGWYTDPKEPEGDHYTMAAVDWWLKDGGAVYFDVPCNPEYAETAHYRTYAAMDAGALLDCTCLEEVARGYSLPEPNAGTWVPRPTVHKHPYYYVAVYAKKVA